MVFDTTNTVTTAIFHTYVTSKQALKIPAVAMYALAFGFFKLVNYVLFFWLPFFLTRTFTGRTSNVISTLYDVGMMPGKHTCSIRSAASRAIDQFCQRRACHHLQEHV
jgi:uncharacterized membrane-anchored protein